MQSETIKTKLVSKSVLKICLNFEKQKNPLKYLREGKMQTLKET